MKKIYGYALATAVGLGAGAMISSKDVSAQTQTTPQLTGAAATAGTDAAFRDGLYMGKHDADQGRLRHVATGRWSTSVDRSQYQTGYDAGYAAH
jgi:uncharacterized protein with FMN-binding domain